VRNVIAITTPSQPRKRKIAGRREEGGEKTV
jgi:hypothetical protein